GPGRRRSCPRAEAPRERRDRGAELRGRSAPPDRQDRRFRRTARSRCRRTEEAGPHIGWPRVARARRAAVLRTRHGAARGPDASDLAERGRIRAGCAVRSAEEPRFRPADKVGFNTRCGDCLTRSRRERPPVTWAFLEVLVGIERPLVLHFAARTPIDLMMT